MEELLRPHELRVDEFSRVKLIEHQKLLVRSWPRYRNCKLRSIVQMIQSNFRMPSQYAVDHHLTFPVNLLYFLSLLSQEDCSATTEISSLTYGKRMVYLETFFLPDHMHILSHLTQVCSIHGMFLLREMFRCKQARGNPLPKVVIETPTQSQLRDFYKVRQPEIHSTLWSDEFYAPFQQSGRCWNSSKDNTRSVTKMMQMNRNVMVSLRNRKHVSQSMMIKANNKIICYLKEDQSDFLEECRRKNLAPTCNVKRSGGLILADCVDLSGYVPDDQKISADYHEKGRQGSHVKRVTTRVSLCPNTVGISPTMCRMV